MPGPALRNTFISSLAVILLAVPAAADHHEAAPEAAAPETSAPETSAPETSAPGASAPADAAAAPAWDQEKVTAFAEELAAAAQKLQREMARQKSQQQVGSGQARAMMEFRDNMRVARDVSRQLAHALRDGRGRDDTSSVYRRLMTLVRDARETGRRLLIKEPALGYIGEANAALDGLAPFYPDITPS